MSSLELLEWQKQLWSTTFKLVDADGIMEGTRNEIEKYMEVNGGIVSFARVLLYWVGTNCMYLYDYTHVIRWSSFPESSEGENLVISWKPEIQ